MDLIIQHEVYRELGAGPSGRDVEADAEGYQREEERTSGETVSRGRASLASQTL